MGKKPTPIETYTTPEAKIDWHKMKVQDFLKKYKVRRETAVNALGKRKRLPHPGYEINRKKIEKVGVSTLMAMIYNIGEVPTSKLTGININVIRVHLTKKKKSYSIKKWKQHGVGLI